MTHTPGPLTLGRRAAAIIVSAFAITAATHIATLLVFFAANGSVAENIRPISDFFLPSTLVLLVLVVVAVVAGVLRRRLLAGLLGIVAGILAALIGTAISVLSSGAAWTADVPAYLLGSLAGSNLVFIISAGIAASTIGPWAWGAVARAQRHPVALVRRPSSRLADGELTHLDRVEVDVALAETQWEGYVAALEEAGFETVEVPAADDLPDSVFVEDALIVFGGTAVVASPGAESRRGETDAVAAVARKQGFTVRTIDLPGTLDGGDVLKVGTTVYVGRGGRTNAEGIAQLREILVPLGYTVVPVPVKKVLHLKSAVTALPDGTVVGYSKHVDAPALFDRFLALPEPGASVVVLSPDLVLMASSVPKSIALIEDLGYTVIPVDISEFEKLEGCVTCLSVRIR